MANKSNAIDLNGTWYDALTGEQLPGKPSYVGDVQHMPVQATPNSARGAASLDGFVTVNATGRPQQPRQAAQHMAPHKAQASQTLMRRVVNKPAVQQATPITAVANPQKLTPASQNVVQTKLSSQTVDPSRAQRAQQAARSQTVNHFKPAQTLAMDGLRPMPRPVAQPTPAAVNVPSSNPQPFQPPVREQAAAPARGRSTVDFVAARRTPQSNFQQARSSFNPRPVQAAPAEQATQPAQDMFEAALAHAASHTEPAPEESMMSGTKRKAKKHRQVLGIVGSVAVFMILAGFIAYQNRSTIQYQLASAKAGFAASIPNYKPAGYDLKKLDYATGSVAALYATKDNSAISITQKKSNWDSQTLLENFVANSGKEYQGYQANGRTVYVYGDGDATWVNGGIWYQIHANQNMPAAQLVKIAANL